MYELGPDVDDLIEIICVEQDEDRKLFAVTELINLGVIAVPLAVAQIKKSLPENRKYFSIVLAGIGEDAVPALVDLLEDSEIRVEIAESLREIGSAAVPVMIQKLEQTKKSDVIKIIAEIFGEIKDRRALEMLKLKDIEDENALIAIKRAIKDIEEPLVNKVKDSIEATKKIDSIVEILNQ